MHIIVNINELIIVRPELKQLNYIILLLESINYK